MGKTLADYSVTFHLVISFLAGRKYAPATGLLPRAWLLVRFGGWWAAGMPETGWQLERQSGAVFLTG
ncbi:MAG: hypothetical protein Q4A16_04070 [Lautropia sp.]|nr:hypothetical protein [Lautropia sp.]